MTRRRWIADNWDDASASLTGTQAEHLARVLRARPGMEFDIVAGEVLRRGVIEDISAGCVRFALGERLETDPALPVALLLAVFKFDRMEWAIEKATELGVDRIVPAIARRTEKHLAHAATARVERWRRIAREAAQQARRSGTVAIEGPVLLKQAVCEAPESFRLLLSENERVITLRDAMEAPDSASETEGHHNDPKRIRIAIGPEGGWTDEEEKLFAIEGWRPVSLGPRILRAETAAVAALSVIAALLD